MAELLMYDRRVDGRRVNELRKISIEPQHSTADGNTRVLVTIFGPRVCSQKINQKVESALVCCMFEKPVFAAMTSDRRPTSERVSTENSTTIEEIFSNVICCEKYPNSQIDIFVQVLQSDGGELSCAINAICLALIDAGIEIYYFAISSSVGLSGSKILADLSRYEEQFKIPQLTLVFVPEQDKTGILNVPATKSKEKLPSSILHVNMCSWVFSKDLQFMIAEASKVAQTIYESFAVYLKNQIQNSCDYTQQ